MAGLDDGYRSPLPAIFPIYDVPKTRIQLIPGDFEEHCTTADRTEIFVSEIMDLPVDVTSRLVTVLDLPAGCVQTS
jgi:hypothetical protein